MEFHEKLQELRKNKGLTQEELASALYVSRTAISKWESGRGYPSIDSLRALAKFFSVSLDELLSSEELLSVAEEDGRQKERRFRDLFFAFVDVGFALPFFLPFFAERSGGAVRAVSLLALTSVRVWLKLSYVAVLCLGVVLGILTLALQGSQNRIWVRVKSSLSLAIHTASVLLFVISSQTYAAAFLFVLLAFKAFWLIKRH